MESLIEGDLFLNSSDCCSTDAAWTSGINQKAMSQQKIADREEASSGFWKQSLRLGTKEETLPVAEGSSLYSVWKRKEQNHPKYLEARLPTKQPWPGFFFFIFFAQLCIRANSQDQIGLLQIWVEQIYFMGTAGCVSQPHD